MPYRVVAPDSGKSRFVQLLPSYTMWGYMYPDTDATGTVRGLATPTPRQANLVRKGVRGKRATQRIRQELMALQKKQATGTLVVEGEGQKWQLYWFMGRLLYATGGVHRVRRWQRVRRTHCPQFEPDWQSLGQATPWEYYALVQGTKQGHVTPPQAKAVILASVLELTLPPPKGGGFLRSP